MVKFLYFGCGPQADSSTLKSTSFALHEMAKAVFPYAVSFVHLVGEPLTWLATLCTAGLKLTLRASLIANSTAKFQSLALDH
jgi:hypothetical protein